MGYSGKIMSSLSTSLKNSYQRWLCPYEEYLRIAKPGVHQQLEQEYGGPLTPSPAQTPIKRSNVNTPASGRGDSPARHASDLLQASINGVKKETDRDTPMGDAQAVPSQAPTSGGFTAINSGGFTAVNSGFTSMNRSNGESKSFTPDVKRFESPSSSAKNTPDNRASSLVATALKRQLSCDSSSDSTKKDVDADKEDGDSGSRRSKRLKKGEKASLPLFLCSHALNFASAMPARARIFRSLWAMPQFAGISGCGDASRKHPSLNYYWSTCP